MVAQSLDVASLRQAAIKAAAAAAAAAEELNAQDAKLGDGDLGITVVGGYGEIAKESDGFTEDLGQTFLLCAKAFQRASASSYGTLTATAFMAMAKHTKGRTEVAWGELGRLLEVARDAMISRGKGALGDKSVLDVLDAVSRAIGGIEEPAAIRAAARAAAFETLARFRNQPCRLGRARAHAQASIGEDDPGMLALCRLIEGL